MRHLALLCQAPFLCSSAVILGSLIVNLYVDPRLRRRRSSAVTSTCSSRSAVKGIQSRSWSFWEAAFPSSPKVAAVTMRYSVMPRPLSRNSSATASSNQ
jgi:hypothetical protein